MQLRTWFALVPLVLAGWSTARAVQEPPSALVARGRVLAPDGLPAEGAVVVSDAGGSVVTDAAGRFELAVERPPTARSLRVNAFAANGADLAASVELALAPAARRLDAGDLELTAGLDCDPGWLPTFGAYPGTGGSVRALLVFDDGTGDGPELYAGGYFPRIGGIQVNHVARWNGSTWEPVGPGFNYLVTSLAVFDDGAGAGAALYAGGAFGYSGGVPVHRVARWDGTTWIEVGGGTDYYVYELDVLDDGSGSGPALYATGNFYTAGGVASRGIARWDGSAWSGLGGGIGGSSQASASTVEVYDDNTGGGPALYVGGLFSTAGGVLAANLARWDGNAWSPVGGGTDGRVEALRAHDDGSGIGELLYVGGDFSAAGGSPMPHVARWDGAVWRPVGSGMDDEVYELRVLDDGSGAGPLLHAGGRFTTAGGVTARAVACWDGVSWSALGAGMTSTGPEVIALATWDDGSGAGASLYAGGDFLMAGDTETGCIARWDGSAWDGLTRGLSLPVADLTVFDDGSGPALHAAGGFATTMYASGVARWNGSDWHQLGGDMDSNVSALIVHDDGTGGGPALYAAGWFTHVDGVPINRIARWDGAGWSPLGSGANSAIGTLCSFDDGNGPALYAGGAFTSAGGATANRIARWDGAAWSPVGSGCDDHVLALAVFAVEGREALYAGGRFLSAGGVPAYCIARWNGQSWHDVGVGMGGPVFALTVFDDGSGEALYAGGRFRFAGYIPVSYVAKWDGTNWSGLDGGTNDWIWSLEVHDDTGGPALYAGGEFTSAGGAPASYIARWDGAAWSSLDEGLDGEVNTLLSFDDGSGPALFAAGEFPTSPAGDSFVAKWGCRGEPGTSYCSCDGSGAAAPCGNDAGAGEGCANSTGAGAVLSGAGSASVSADDLVFVGANLLPGQPALLFVGDQRVNGGDGLAFGDGLRCAGSNVRRLGSETPDVSGAASWGPGLSAPGDLDPGETRRFQVWYRDPSGGPCASGFNLTNGYEVALVP